MWTRRILPVTLCVLMLGVLSLSAYRSQPPAVPAAVNDTWDSFSVDLTFQSSTIDDQGTAVAPDRPATSYRLQRTRAGSHWQTRMTVLDAPPADAAATRPQNPFEIVRMEDDGDGSAVRLFDRAGTLVDRRDAARALLAAGLPFAKQEAQALDTVPAGVPTSAKSGDPSGGLVIRRGGENTRLNALQRRMGNSRGQVRGLQRFVQVTGNDLDEVLVDPVSVLPVEMNRVREGALVAHINLDYAPAADGTIRQQHVRVERVDPRSRWHVVTTLQMANHRLERGR